MGASVSLLPNRFYSLLFGQPGISHDDPDPVDSSLDMPEGFEAFRNELPKSVVIGRGEVGYQIISRRVKGKEPIIGVLCGSPVDAREAIRYCTSRGLGLILTGERSPTSGPEWEMPRESKADEDMALIDISDAYKYTGYYSEPKILRVGCGCSGSEVEEACVESNIEFKEVTPDSHPWTTLFSSLPDVSEASTEQKVLTKSSLVALDVLEFCGNEVVATPLVNSDLFNEFLCTGSVVTKAGSGGGGVVVEMYFKLAEGPVGKQSLCEYTESDSPNTTTADHHLPSVPHSSPSHDDSPHTIDRVTL